VVADVRSESLGIADTAVAPSTRPHGNRCFLAQEAGGVELTGTERTIGLMHVGRSTSWTTSDSCGGDRRSFSRLSANRGRRRFDDQQCRVRRIVSIAAVSSGTMASDGVGTHRVGRGRRGVRPGNDVSPPCATFTISERIQDLTGIDPVRVFDDGKY